jgi:hypothetical protein
MNRAILFTAGALALPAAAQAPDATKLRATYERLCTGDAPASVATCEALRGEMDKAGVPGTVGWSGLLIGAPDDGTKAIRVFAADPNSPAAKAGIRTGDLLVAQDGRPFSDVNAYLKHAGAALAGQQVTMRIVRGAQILDLPVKLAEPPKPNPKLNAQRTDRGAYSLWSGSAVTVDRVRVGEHFYGILEDSDASSDWGKREDCIEIAEPGPAKNLSAFVTPNGAKMSIYVQYDRCGPGQGAAAWLPGADANKTFGINLATVPGRKTFVMVSGASSAKPYELIVREQTPKETGAWRVAQQQQRIAAEQQRQAEERAAADRRMMWGAALQGLVVGLSGAEMPAMRADGTMPNMLDTLNAANAALERKNAEGAARLNETIARAQAQGDQQRRDAAAREEAQRQAQRAQREESARAMGEARLQTEQKLREAIRTGDRAQQAYYVGVLNEQQRTAQQNGYGNELNKYVNENAARYAAAPTEAGQHPQQATAQQQAEQQRLAEQQRFAQQKAEQDRLAQLRLEDERKKAEAQRQADLKRQAEQQKQAQLQARRAALMARNSSGNFSNVGLPPVPKPSRPPGSGSLSFPVSNVGGCEASQVEVRWNLNALLGDATVAGTWGWTGEEGCPAPASARVWIKLQHGTAYGWVAIDPAVPNANRGMGYNSTGSPAWSRLVCSFQGASINGCMDEESARRMWAHGQVTEAKIAW